MKANSQKQPDDSFIGEYRLFIYLFSDLIYITHIYISDKCYNIFITEPWDKGKINNDDDEDEDDEDDNNDDEGDIYKIGALKCYECIIRIYILIIV